MAQVLLSKSYQQKSDHRFADQVAQAALFTGNRQNLYQWLKEEPKTEIASSSILAHETTPVAEVAIAPIVSEPAPQHSESLPAQVLETTAAVEKPIPTPPPVIELSDLSRLAGEMIDEEQQEVHIQMTPASIVVEPVFEPVLEKKESEAAPTEQSQEESYSIDHLIHEEDTRPETPVLDDLQREILLEAIQSSIEQEVTEDAAEMSPVTVDAPDSSNSTEEELANEDSYTAWIYRRAKQMHFGEENADSTPVNQQIESSTPEIGQQDTEIEDAPQEEEEMDTPQDPLPTLSHGIKRIQPSDYEQHKRNLMDRFIQSEPRITPNKTPEYTPGNLAKDSVEEDFSFITETMAHLYAKQGRFDKARKAFKKLIELYPEKSVYFAAQLKNLDKLKKP